MARTIRISKSKALNFKKLTFLYLIFIVFFFFSTSGDFIKHFMSLSVTQGEYNERLLTQLKEYKSMGDNEKEMIARAIRVVDTINNLNTRFLDFAVSTNLKGERLREQNFSKKYILPKEPSKNLHVALSDFVLGFPVSYQNDLAADLGVKPENLILKESVKNQLFVDAPNGAIGSILNHMETVVLTHTLKYLKQEIKEGGFIKVSSSKDSSFLQGFKDTYYVGEDISFDFFSRDSIAPTVSINQMSMTPNYRGRHYKINWKPVAEGTYQMEANIGEEYIRRTLKVVKPTLRFLENDQEIAAFIGEPLSLTVDMNGLEKIRNLRFTSNGAEVVTRNGQLIVTPLFEGRFTIEMKSGDLVLDSRSMFAGKGKPPVVVLKDIAGEETSFANAHCLESKTPFWQVVNFNMTLIGPDGKKTKVKSQSRYLRNELRSIEKSAARGSTIIFDQIRLLNSGGLTTTIGAPIYLGK